jgi:cytochrome c biogenesis protein
MVVSFTDLKQYSVFTLARDPGVPVVAVAAALLLVGLVPSLYVTRRRVWVRAAPDGAGGTRVELAGLALQGKAAFEGELARLAEQVARGSGRRGPGNPEGVPRSMEHDQVPPEDRGTLEPPDRSR